MFEALDQPMINQFIEVVQRCISWTIKYILSWSTTQCYNVWQWKDKKLDGVNREEEEEWGCVAEELGGATEEDAEWTLLMRYSKSHTCIPCYQSRAYNGQGWSKGAAKCWENNCVLNHSDFSSTEQVCNLTIGTVLYTIITVTCMSMQ